MDKITLDTIIERVKQGEGLNKIIISLELPLQETLLYMQRHHRAEYNEAKDYAIANSDK